ncbi:nuclear transport factor 2 family protein [Halococcus sp. AFM35]|uniref:nuclear transport factor 2 family protein n=1 Tax=Halococcus sp. AFM35 TaxID=3421653 RepID=UPI003EB78299
MSSTSQQSNLEIVKEAYDAFARGAIDDVMAIMDTDIEWVEAEGAPYGGVYHGPEQVLENVFAMLAEEWDEYVVEPERFVEDGDTVVALGTEYGTYAETGKRFEAPFAHAVDLEDGTMVRFQQYVDTAVLNEPLVG